MTSPIAAASLAVTASFAIAGWFFVEGLKWSNTLCGICHD